MEHTYLVEFTNLKTFSVTTFHFGTYEEACKFVRWEEELLIFHGLNPACDFGWAVREQ